jgi:hypothetical protein
MEEKKIREGEIFTGKVADLAGFINSCPEEDKLLYITSAVATLLEVTGLDEKGNKIVLASVLEFMEEFKPQIEKIKEGGN